MKYFKPAQAPCLPDRRRGRRGEAGIRQWRPTSRKIGRTSQSKSEKREEFFCPNFNRIGFSHFSKFVFFSERKFFFYNPFTYVQKVAVVVITKGRKKTKLTAQNFFLQNWLNNLARNWQHWSWRTSGLLLLLLYCPVGLRSVRRADDSINSVSQWVRRENWRLLELLSAVLKLRQSKVLEFIPLSFMNEKQDDNTNLFLVYLGKYEGGEIFRKVLQSRL
jgi:hypothetical protein